MRRFLWSLAVVCGVIGGGLGQQKDAKPADGAEDGGLETNAVTYVLDADGVKWDVHRNKATDDFQADKPFVFIRPVKLARPNGPIFDAATNTVRFDVLLTDPSEKELLAAADRVLNRYKPEVRQQVAAASVPLNPAPLVGYEVRLAVGGQQVVLRRKIALLAGTTQLRIEEPVADEQIRQLLRAGKVAATAEFYGLYKFRQTAVDLARVTNRMAATSQVFEQVFGKNPDPVYYVNRRILDKLTVSLDQTIQSVFETTDPARVPDLQKQVARRLKETEPATLAELRDSVHQVLAYGADGQKLDLKGITKSDLVTRDVRNDERFQSFEKTWDDLTELATKSGGEFEAYNYVRKGLEKERKSGGSGGASLFFGLHKGNLSGSTSFWESEETVDSFASKRREVREFLDRHKSAGSQKEVVCYKLFTDVTGERRSMSVEAKNIELYRVEQAAMVQTLTEEFRVVVNKGTITRPHLTQLTLAGGDFLTDQQRFDALLRGSREQLQVYESPEKFIATPLSKQRMDTTLWPNKSDPPEVLKCRTAVVETNDKTTLLDADAQRVFFGEAWRTEFGREIEAAWLVTTDIMRTRPGFGLGGSDNFFRYGVRIDPKYKNRVVVYAEPDAKEAAVKFKLVVVYKP